MCRFTLYLGSPVRLSALLFEPQHSLIQQSVRSQERFEPLNGDGFGIGWYAADAQEEPGVFRSITPAWNNRNLASLSKVVSSSCIMAHVRAASNMSGVNEANCHPFRFERLLFMHNGDVEGFRSVRRALLESVSDEAFNNVYGSTDSEHIFALVVDELKRIQDGDPALRYAKALRRAIWRVVDLVRERGDNQSCSLNLALSDGDVAVVSRFSANTDEDPESLYMYSGAFPFAGSRGGETPRGSAQLISSERLSDDAGWSAIPPNHLVILVQGREPLLLPCEREESVAKAA